MTNNHRDILGIRPKGSGTDGKINLRINLLGFGFLILASVLAFRGITIHHDVTLKTESYSPIRIDLRP